MSTGALPGPLRHFQAQLADLRSGGTLDMDQVGRLLVELAADQGFFAPLIAAMPADSPPVHWLIPARPRPTPGTGPPARRGHGLHPLPPLLGRPCQGPRSRTHQRWHAIRHDDGGAELRLADEQAPHCGDVATLIPPTTCTTTGTSPARAPPPTH